MRAAILALTVGGVAAQQLTLQPCNNTFAPAVFTWTGNVPKDGNGKCIGTSGGSGAAITAQACTPGSLSQSWILQADGTLASAANTGLCFNVFGGNDQPGTELLLYACGEMASSSSRVGQCHSYFAKEADGTLKALESGLCVSSAVVPPPPPPPPGQCTSDWDCSLNGACSPQGTCTCYPPWTGTLNCESLEFNPSPLQRGYPTPGHNETTWGGSIVLDPVGGLYHMYVAEMMNECPLNTWGQNSRCTHATSPTPEGPYVFADVSVQNWCHNPAIVLQKGGGGGGKDLYALFHIGDGTGGSVKNCSTGGAEAGAGTGAAAAAAQPAYSTTGAAGGSSLHISTSPNGPFVPANPLPSCNNPAPWLHTNGTWFVVCNGFTLYRSDSIQGPWVHVTDIRSSGGAPLPGNYEDPFFWVDARGNWHVIYHVYRTGGAEAHNCLPGHDGSVVSGHYFSKDGYTWHGAATSPYGNVIDLEDGSQQLVTTRERPKMIFNAAGDPTHLSNGVCPSPGNFNTPISCPQVSTGCVDCKYNDWDFTNVSPLKI